MKRIAIVGAGGINSWVVEHLTKVTEMFGKRELIYVKLFDDDEVEEKNLLRSNQNFEVNDLMEQKAKALANKYKLDYNITFITPENIDLLSNFDDIILGVDNHKTRKLIYEFAISKGKFLLDMRAQGTQIAYYIVDHKKGIEHYNKKFFSNEKIMDRKGSCQLTVDIENDNIQNGNKIIAYLAIYGPYFQHLRNEEIVCKELKLVY